MGRRNRGDFSEYQCFFITTTCHNFLHLLSIGENYRIIRDSLLYVNEKYKADILAYVLMPNHIHIIVCFIFKNYQSSYMRDFKKFTSVKLRREISAIEGEDTLNKLIFHRGFQKFKVWQDRFDSFELFSRRMVEQKLEYIHNNPTSQKWALVDTPEMYKYSSACFYEFNKQGFLPVVDYREYF